MLKATFKIVSGNVAWGGIYGNIEDQPDLIGKFNDVQAEIDDTTGLVDNLEIRLSALGKTVDDNYADLSERVNSNYDAITNHILDLNNPHEVTKSQIGLSNVDNTSDINKPISTATQTALNGLDDKITVNSGLINDLDIRLSALGSTVQQDYIELDNKISANTDNISDIQDLIPNQATSTNQLADKQFVNSAIQTNSAHFRGNWSTWANVPTDVNDYPADDDGNKTPTTNDYMVVQNASDYTGDTLVGAWQFTYTGLWATNGKSGWQPRFQINESPLTPAQQTALDSGITPALVTQIGTNQSDIQTINTTLSGFGNIVTHNTSEFATSAQGTKADTALQATDIVSSVDSSSTNTKAVGAKLFYDTCGDIETLINAL